MARMTPPKPLEPDVAEAPKAPEAAQAPDAQELRKKLLTRVAAAAVMIIALLGVLVLFDKLNEPPPKIASAPPAATEPQATAAAPEVKAPEAQAPEAPVVAAAPAEEGKKVEEIAAETETTTAPVTTPPAKAERPLTKPATGRLAIHKPSEPIAAARPSHPAAELAKPSRPLTQAAESAQPSRPQTQAAESAQTSRPLTRAAEALRGYMLQLGVFNNVANAEELRAKLELNGIPSQIEARVQVGPFSTRQEAEAARNKLKELGMEPGLVVAVKK